MPDLDRLIQRSLTDAGWDATGAVLALFSTTGFTPELARVAARRSDVELVDLARLYGDLS